MLSQLCISYCSFQSGDAFKLYGGLFAVLLRHFLFGYTLSHVLPDLHQWDPYPLSDIKRPNGKSPRSDKSVTQESKACRSLLKYPNRDEDPARPYVSREQMREARRNLKAMEAALVELAAELEEKDGGEVEKRTERGGAGGRDNEGGEQGSKDEKKGEESAQHDDAEANSEKENTTTTKKHPQPFPENKQGNDDVEEKERERVEMEKEKQRIVNEAREGGAATVGRKREKTAARVKAMKQQQKNAPEIRITVGANRDEAVRILARKDPVWKLLLSLHLQLENVGIRSLAALDEWRAQPTGYKLRVIAAHKLQAAFRGHLTRRRVEARVREDRKVLQDRLIALQQVQVALRKRRKTFEASRAARRIAAAAALVEEEEREDEGIRI